MNSGTIFEPYDRNFDPYGRYQGTANYNAILTNLVSQPTEAFDEDLFPYYCYCYDSLHNKLSHVGSLSHDGETFTIHTVPVSSDGYLKHFVSCVTALGPDMLVGNAERCTPSNFTSRIQYYNPLNVDFSAYRIGFSFYVINMETGSKEWVNSIDELKALDTTKYIVEQTAGRLFFKDENTGDWGGFVQNDNTSSIIYNCNDRVIYAKSSARFTGASGIDVVPHWTMGCLKNGTVVAANAEMNDADTGFLIAGVVNTVDGEVELPISEKYNFTDDGLVIEVIEDWDNRDRITITTRLSIEQTLKEIAYLGLIVCHYSGATESVYAGYIDPDGLATGELIPYEDWEETDSLNVKNQFMVDFPDIHVKPKPTPEPTDSDDIDSVTIGYKGSENGFIRHYQVTSGNLENISVAISNDKIHLGAFDRIISLKTYAVNTSNFIETSASISEQIIIGGVETGVTAPRIVYTKSDYLIGKTVVRGVYGNAENPNFLDYAPYTQIEVYIPYCGLVPLPDWCMYKTIYVYLVSDIITGGCKGVVICDGNIVAECTGVLGIDCAITAENNALKNNAMLQTINNSVGIGANMIKAGSVGNIGGMVTTAAQGLANAQQTVIASNSNYATSMGSCPDRLQWALPNVCRLHVYSPIINKPSNYNHSFGKPLCETRVLSSISGYTECDNVDLTGINCTNAEKEMIKSLLESGVYL